MSYEKNKSYENFHWEKYKNCYDDLKHITRKNESWEHWINHGKNENREFFYILNNNSLNESLNDNSLNDDSLTNNSLTNNSLTNNSLNNFLDSDQNDDKCEEFIKIREKYYKILEEKKNFDWLQYTYDNKDLICILDEKHAWHHWILHGHREKRILKNINNNTNKVNTTENHNGRFGNLFFVNMVMHFISEKYNLKVNYKYHNKFINLGINLHIGTNTYTENTYLTELNYFDLINKNDKFTNIIINNNTWFQNYEFCFFLQLYFNKSKIKNKILQKNKFKDRYSKNNDLFVHVRLDDIEDDLRNNNFDYYDNIIKKYEFNNGYIASDNLNSKICIELVKKYSLKIVNFNEEETIMFGSTCNIIVLSGGTFSWLIGFLAYYSKNINYPINSKKWYGDIFVYENWIGNN